MPPIDPQKPGHESLPSVWPHDLFRSWTDADGLSIGFNVQTRQLTMCDTQSGKQKTSCKQCGLILELIASECKGDSPSPPGGEV